MAIRRTGIVLEQIRTLFDEGRIGTMTDEQLLRRFARGAEADRGADAAELAFEIWSCGTGRWSWAYAAACFAIRTRLKMHSRPHFSSWRRAGSIRKAEVWAVGCEKWRTGSHRGARVLSIRRARIGPPQAVSAIEDPGTIAECDELCTAVLDEIQLLPEKYRLPVQLCYIEGQTHDEAARRLDWPVGTVRTRLAWARDRLRARLTVRGLVVPAGFVGRVTRFVEGVGRSPGPNRQGNGRDSIRPRGRGCGNILGDKCTEGDARVQAQVGRPSRSGDGFAGLGRPVIHPGRRLRKPRGRRWFGGAKEGSTPVRLRRQGTGEAPDGPGGWDHLFPRRG